MRPLTIAALLVVSGAFSACSGGDKIVGANGESVIPSNSLAAADSVFLVNFMSAGAWGLMKQMRGIANMQVTGFGSTRPACTPQAIIGGLDANGNGVPDDQTTSYSATSCTFLSGGANTTAAGSFRLQDLGTLYGYRVTYTNYVLSATKGDSVVTSTLNGSVEYRYASGSSGTTADNTTLTIRSQSSSGSITLTRTAALTGTLTPSSGSFSIAAFPGATFSVSGTLGIQLALTGNAVQAGYPANSTFNIVVSTATALVSPSSCLGNPGFTTGTLSGALTGTWTANLRMTYTACGSGAAEAPGTKR